jgi:hypothetical protein
MKIGIFGDSYASEYYGPVSWSHLLRTQYHYNIHNYAWPATCLFWSYQQLVKNIDIIDTIIFVATNPGRLYWPDATTNLDSLHQISGLWTVQHTLKAHPSMAPDRLAVFKAAEQYYLNLANYEFDEFVHGLIIKEIIRLCGKRGKKLIMIPAFNVSITRRSAFQCSLRDVSEKELTTQFGPRHRGYVQEKRYTRANHMSKENNIVFAGIVDKLLRDEVFSIGLDNFVFKKVADPELYWDI